MTRSPRRLHLQLQRHGRRLAPRGDRGRGRLARRHDLRGHRPLLPRAPGGLPRRLPARRPLPERAARAGGGAQEPAAPLGQGADGVLPEAHAASLWRSRPAAAQEHRRRRSTSARTSRSPRACFMTVVTLPVMLAAHPGRGAGHRGRRVDTSVFLLVVVTQLLFYAVATREVHANWWQRLRFLPFFPLVGVGPRRQQRARRARGAARPPHGVRAHAQARRARPRPRGRRQARARTYVGVKEVLQPALEADVRRVLRRDGVRADEPRALRERLITGILSAGLFTMGGASLRAILVSRAAGEPARGRRPRGPRRRGVAAARRPGGRRPDSGLVRRLHASRRVAARFRRS